MDDSSSVTARPAGWGKFRTEIAVRGARIVADEPIEVGGGGEGPTPFELLSAALAACTSMTLRLYAQRKGWTLPTFTVEVGHHLAGTEGAGPDRDRFDRRIAFDAPLPEEQSARLLEIADKCPVHRTLMRGFEVTTRYGVPGTAEPPARHEQEMERACED
ncbi:OsmC family protein [Sphingosinicella terrae]|jgi:putative redox protein|uniref:OsmC family protein n=1 Tax=Sphingosinicella terrae TaxID=2172047 RepID=UPI000E0D17C3|nr:OsmC family protein [Sphingosinicella terrae]